MCFYINNELPTLVPLFSSKKGKKRQKETEKCKNTDNHPMECAGDIRLFE